MLLAHAVKAFGTTSHMAILVYLGSVHRATRAEILRQHLLPPPQQFIDTCWNSRRSDWS